MARPCWLIQKLRCHQSLVLSRLRSRLECLHPAVGLRGPRLRGRSRTLTARHFMRVLTSRSTMIAYESAMQKSDTLRVSLALGCRRRWLPRPPSARGAAATARVTGISAANPLVLPARLCGAAAGNRSHRYIGKVCCLLLVRADYIRPRPRARPRGHGELLKLLRRMTRLTGTQARRDWHGCRLSV